MVFDKTSADKMASDIDVIGEFGIAVRFLHIHTINSPVYTFISGISENTYL